MTASNLYEEYDGVSSQVSSTVCTYCLLCIPQYTTQGNLQPTHICDGVKPVLKLGPPFV